MSGRKRVVLSCTHSSTYDFFLPIAIKLWRDRIGYEPIVFLIGEEKEWGTGHRAVVLQEVLNLQPWVGFVGRVPGVPDANVSMAIRQHASALEDLNPADLILVGDIDLFPIRREFYHQHDPSQVPIAIYHSDMYWDTYWPAYGPSMTVETWREVMDLIVGSPYDSLLRTMRNGKILDLIEANEKDNTDSRLWTFDEQYASVRIKESRYCSRILRIKTDENDRLCRNKWLETADVSKYIDCHCPRPGWSYGNWIKIRRVLEQLIPDDMSWLDRYVDAYRSSSPSIGNPSV